MLDSFDRLGDLLDTLGMLFLCPIDSNAYDTPHFLRFDFSYYLPLLLPFHNLTKRKIIVFCC